MASQNEKILQQYNIGDIVSIEHPDGSGVKLATITTFTASESDKRDGVMVKFEDGTFIDVSASYLPDTEARSAAAAALGSSRSPAKAAAARANGAKSKGRPRKTE